MREDEETLPAALRALRDGAHAMHTVALCESAWVQEAWAKGITDQAKSGATPAGKKSASMAHKRGEKSTDLS